MGSSEAGEERFPARQASVPMSRRRGAARVATKVAPVSGPVTRKSRRQQDRRPRCPQENSFALPQPRSPCGRSGACPAWSARYLFAVGLSEATFSPESTTVGKALSGRFSSELSSVSSLRARVCRRHAAAKSGAMGSSVATQHFRHRSRDALEQDRSDRVLRLRATLLAYTEVSFRFGIHALKGFEVPTRFQERRT